MRECSSASGYRPPATKSAEPDRPRYLPSVAIRYRGCRSGKTFETPVNYARSGDRLKISVMAPDSKQWWRNFVDDGGPVTLVNFDGRDRTGHAIANRDPPGASRYPSSWTPHSRTTFPDPHPYSGPN